MTPARHMWTLFEPIHAVTYVAPEGRATFKATAAEAALPPVNHRARHELELVRRLERSNAIHLRYRAVDTSH